MPRHAGLLASTSRTRSATRRLRCFVCCCRQRSVRRRIARPRHRSGPCLRSTARAHRRPRPAQTRVLALCETFARGARDLSLPGETSNTQTDPPRTYWVVLFRRAARTPRFWSLKPEWSPQTAAWSGGAFPDRPTRASLVFHVGLTGDPALGRLLEGIAPHASRQPSVARISSTPATPRRRNTRSYCV